MVQVKEHSALFFLFIFTAYLLCGSVVKGFSYQTKSLDRTRVMLKKACDNNQHTIHISQAPKKVDKAQEIPENTSCSVKLIPCSSSLQILPVSNSFLCKPDQQDQLIQIEGSFFKTQTVVFQEPDPPRLG